MKQTKTEDNMKNDMFEFEAKQLKKYMKNNDLSFYDIYSLLNSLEQQSKGEL